MVAAAASQPPSVLLPSNRKNWTKRDKTWDEVMNSADFSPAEPSVLVRGSAVGLRPVDLQDRGQTGSVFGGLTGALFFVLTFEALSLD